MGWEELGIVVVVAVVAPELIPPAGSPGPDPEGYIVVCP